MNVTLLQENWRWLIENKCSFVMRIGSQNRITYQRSCGMTIVDPCSTHKKKESRKFCRGRWHIWPHSSVESNKIKWNYYLERLMKHTKRFPFFFWRWKAQAGLGNMKLRNMKVQIKDKKLASKVINYINYFSRLSFSMVLWKSTKDREVINMSMSFLCRTSFSCSS